MTWGIAYMYYNCPQCGKKYKYGLDLMAQFGEDFGKCPDCNILGQFECDGPRKKDDNLYYEVE